MTPTNRVRGFLGRAYQAIASLFAILILTSVALQFSFPPKIEREEALIILQSLIQLNGFLIGFVGVIVTLFLTRPGGSRAEASTTLGYALATLILFITSIFTCVWVLAQMTANSFLYGSGLTLPLTTFIAGIFWVFLMVWKAVNSSQPQPSKQA